MADPWFKFYPTDWRSDPALRMCSLAARGLWVEMLCVMHEAHPYGHLLVNGHSPTDAQIGVLVGAPPSQITAMLGELDMAGVFSRTRSGVIYSRKMTRMIKKAATARNNGRKGGNPKLRKETEKSTLDNPPHKAQDKPQKPEARSQIRNKDHPLDDPTFPEFWEIWPLRKQGKKKAEQAFRRLSQQNKRAAIDGVVGWGRQWRASNPGANDIHPSSYLNGERWKDEFSGGSEDSNVARFRKLAGK